MSAYKIISRAKRQGVSLGVLVAQISNDETKQKGVS